MSAESASTQVADETGLRAAWYPTLRVAEVRRRQVAVRKPSAFTLLDQPIVLWCVDEGPIIAQEDRCAHEDAELTTGYCRNGVLICGHHGWTHDPDGTSRPPGGRNWKPPAEGWRKIAVYSAAELADYVWVALDPPTQPPLGGSAAGSLARQFAVSASRLFEAARTQLDRSTGVAPLAAAAGSLTFIVTPMKTERAQLTLFTGDAGSEADLSALLDRVEASL